MLQGGYKQIYTETFNPADSQVSFELPPGDYEKLIFRLEGTNDTGQTLDIAALGQLEISDSGFYNVRVGMDFLDDLAGLKGGVMERASTTAGAIDWYVPFMFNLWEDEVSVFTVSNNQKVRVVIHTTGTLDTNITGNATLTVFGVMKTGLQPYRLRYNFRDFTGAGRISENLNAEDVVAVYVENNTNLNRISYFQDGKQAVDSPRDALISLTHDDNQLETYSATFPWLELNFNRNQDITTIKNSQNLLELEMGSSDTVTVVIVTMDYTPNELAATKASKQLEVDAQNQRKAARGQNRALAVESLLASGAV